MNRNRTFSVPPGRRVILVAGMVLALVTLIWRAVSLQVLDKDFLQVQGDARHLRVEVV